MARNKAIILDIPWINNIQLSETDIISEAASAKFTDQKCLSESTTQSCLLRAISCIDLASLSGDETPENIAELCNLATSPAVTTRAGSEMSKIPDDALKIKCAAVCVYPLRIEDACRSLKALTGGNLVQIASVAAGFPTGQYPLHTRLAEIYYAVASGAQEIDVVIDRSLVLRGLWEQLYQELVEMRRACGQTVLKVILSVTECGSLANVYKAAVVAMSAGADFIKTSTGKEAKTMTINHGLVMCRAIKEFHERTGIKVGLKPAGGVRTAEHAISWMLMMQEVLGEEWVNPTYFRLGTSGTSTLIDSIVTALEKA